MAACKKSAKRRKSTRGQGDRLTDQQRRRIVQLVAEFRSSNEIADQVAEEFGIERPHESLVRWYRHSSKWQSTIAKCRADLARTITNIGVANKFRRLLILDKEIAKARQSYFTGEAKSGREIYKQDRSALAAMLRLAAEEMGELRQLVDVSPQEHVFRIVYEDKKT